MLPCPPPQRNRSTSWTKNGHSMRQLMNFVNCNLSSTELLHNLPFRVDPVSAQSTQGVHLHAPRCNVLGDFVANYPRRLTVQELCLAHHGRIWDLGTLNLTHVVRP